MPHKIPDKIRLAMINFQFLELHLKNAVSKIEYEIQERLKPEFHFPGNAKTIEKMGLIKVASLYSTYMKDPAFLEHIKEIATRRNILAHRFFFLTSGFELNPEQSMIEEADAIYKSGERAADLGDYVFEKTQKYFVDLEDDFFKRENEE